MFVIVLTYIKPLEEVDKLVASHIEFLEQQYRAGIFLASGARVPRTGGVILATCDDKTKLLEILKQDPFSIAHVAEYDCIEFTPSRMREGFEQFIHAGGVSEKE